MTLKTRTLLISSLDSAVNHRNAIWKRFFLSLDMSLMMICILGKIIKGSSSAFILKLL